MQLETNPVIQLQMQRANSKNKTIRSIVIKIVVHHGAMDTPEASIASLWEMLTSTPWWTTILITILLIVLFAPCICNCITGFVSSRMKAFKLQMVAQTPATAAAAYLGPLDQISSI